MLYFRSSFIYLLFLFFPILSLSSSSSSCLNVLCSPQNETTTTCVHPILSDNTATLTKCQKDLMCDISPFDPLSESKCVKKKLPKKFAGLSCNEDADCYSEKCENKKCKGIQKEEECKKVEQCEYGLTCDTIKQKCVEPLKEGEKCVVDTDCGKEYGCLNRKCTKYYSIPDGKMIYISKLSSDLHFCQSGYANELGECQTITLPSPQMKCSNEDMCQYILSSSNTTNTTYVTIPENCLCGFNTKGDKYCLIGNGNQNYTRYLKLWKEYYFGNSLCHLAERNATGCQKDLYSGDEELVIKIHEMINAKYWAKHNNYLIEAPECVYPVEIPEYDRDLDKHPTPPVTNGSCAVYTCSTIIKNNTRLCASSNYGGPNNISVILSDRCPNDVQCNIGGDPNIVFYNRTNVTAYCQNSATVNRYPGESCDSDIECVYPLSVSSTQFHKCVDGRCIGLTLGVRCKADDWCVAGYFCDKVTSTCTEQKPEGKACFDTFECRNNLLCIQGKCGEMFQQADGETVEDKSEFGKMYCKNMTMINGKCVSYSDLKYDEAYKPCKFGEICEYNIHGLEGNTKYKVECPCGFNDKGIGYCPQFHDHNQESLELYREVLIKGYNSECHTHSRYNCYDNKQKERIKFLENKILKGHLYNNAIDCAQKVLSDSFIKLNIFSILISFIILFN